MAAQLLRKFQFVSRNSEHVVARGCLSPAVTLRKFVSGSSASEGTKPPPVGEGSKSSGEAYDLNVYRVQEYFSYNEFSFYDVEKDMAISRLTQPDPKQEYVHSNPWKSSA